MSNDTGNRKVDATAAGEGLVELGMPLEELVRRGARTIIQRAIEAEVQTLLAEYEQVRLLDGCQAAVRNGYLPSREILTGMGPVEVQVPKVRAPCGIGRRVQLGVSARLCAPQPAGVSGAAVAVSQGGFQWRPQ